MATGRLSLLVQKQQPAQKRYAPIEGEYLEAAYGLERCRMYTLGCPKLILAGYHKLLTNILNNRYLDTIKNPRLCRLKERTFAFKYDIKYVPGGPNAMKVPMPYQEMPLKIRKTMNSKK